MPLDPRIALAVVPPQFTVPQQTPFELQTGFQNLQQLMQGTQEGAIKLEQARIALEEQKNLADYFRNAFSPAPAAPTTVSPPAVTPPATTSPAVTPTPPGGTSAATSTGFQTPAPPVSPGVPGAGGQMVMGPDRNGRAIYSLDGGSTWKDSATDQPAASAPLGQTSVIGNIGGTAPSATLGSLMRLPVPAAPAAAAPTTLPPILPPITLPTPAAAPATTAAPAPAAAAPSGAGGGQAPATISGWQTPTTTPPATTTTTGAARTQPLATGAAPATAQFAPVTGVSPSMPSINVGEILRRAPTTGMAVAKTYLDMYKNNVEALGKDLENSKNQAAQLGSIADSVLSSNDPAGAYPGAVYQAVGQKLITEGTARTLLAHGYDPDWLTQVRNRAQTVAEQHTTAKTDADTHAKDMENAGNSIENVNDQTSYTNWYSRQPKDIQALLGPTYSPQLKYSVQGWSVPSQERPGMFQKETQNAAMTLAPAIARGEDAFNAELKNYPPEIQKVFAGAKTPMEVQQRALNATQYMEIYKPTGDFERDFLPTYAAGLNKTPAQLTAGERMTAWRDYKTTPLEQTKQMLDIIEKRMQVGQMPTQAQVDAVAGDFAAHKISPDQLNTMFGGRGEQGKGFIRQVYAAAKQRNPEMNLEQAQAEYDLVKSPGFQNTVRYMDSVTESLPQLIDRAQKLGNWGIRSLNDEINKGKDMFNFISLKRFNTDRLLLADEVAKILQGGGTGGATSDAKLQQAEKIFRENDDPSAIRAAAEEVRDLIGNRRRALTRGTYFENTAPQMLQPVSDEVKKVLSDPKYAAGKAYPGNDGQWYKKNADGTIERMIAPPPGK